MDVWCKVGLFLSSSHTFASPFAVHQIILQVILCSDEINKPAPNPTGAFIFKVSLLLHSILLPITFTGIELSCTFQLLLRFAFSPRLAKLKVPFVPLNVNNKRFTIFREGQPGLRLPYKMLFMDFITSWLFSASFFYYFFSFSRWFCTSSPTTSSSSCLPFMSSVAEFNSGSHGWQGFGGED